MSELIGKEREPLSGGSVDANIPGQCLHELSYAKKPQQIIKYGGEREKERKFTIHDPEIRNRKTRIRLCVKVCFLSVHKTGKDSSEVGNSCSSIH